MAPSLETLQDRVYLFFATQGSAVSVPEACTIPSSRRCNAPQGRRRRAEPGRLALQPVCVVAVNAMTPNETLPHDAMSTNETSRTRPVMKRWAGALLVLSVLTFGAGSHPPLLAVVFPDTITVGLHGPNARHESTHYTFPAPVMPHHVQLQVVVQVPLTFVKRPSSAIQLWAKDAQQRWQNTVWADGLLSPENPMFDARTGTLTLSYQPTPMEISQQGWTQVGFQPEAGIREVGIKIGLPSAAAPDYALNGVVRVISVRTDYLTRPAQQPAIITPLLRRDAGVPDDVPRPVAPRDVKSGVSRYFVYGDLHRWNDVQSRVVQALQAQQAQGCSAFRLMGGLDIRRQTGGSRLGFSELSALAAYLEIAKATDQRWHIITLFDGAVPNDTLRDAMRDATARRALLDTYRPLIRQFGTATIHGEPVIFDLVNEIQAVGAVTERQRQQFVEDLIELFIHDAPGATLTLGVGDYHDLVYWLHLFPKYAHRPVRLIVTFHRYEAFDELPAVWELNIPNGTEVGITEADTRHDMVAQLTVAAAKGYRWLLFWQDRDHPYDPATHRQVIDHADASASP